MKALNKKGMSMGDLSPMVYTLIVVGALALAGFVTWQALADSTTNTAATAFLGNITLMTSNIGAQLPTIGTLIGVGLLIGVVVVAFVAGKRTGYF